MIERRAVVLLSGGIDSTTALAAAKAEGYAVYALTVEYGQRHGVEVEAARRVARALGVREHRVLSLDLRAMGGSALTGDLAVPKDRPVEAMAKGIPVTYVPARNTILLALALAWAEVLEAETIVMGANVLDYSGYPDCRPEFLRAFESMANLATKVAVEGRMRVRIEAPLLKLTKAEILRKGAALGVDYALTHSCYDPAEGRACGRCDSCLLRKKGFAEAGLLDPTLYAA